jgi:hypothetical protein
MYCQRIIRVYQIRPIFSTIEIKYMVMSYGKIILRKSRGEEVKRTEVIDYDIIQAVFSLKAQEFMCIDSNVKHEFFLRLHLRFSCLSHVIQKKKLTCFMIIYLKAEKF